MTDINSDNTTVNNNQLYSTLWQSADILRSKMDANDYKNYLLGLVFYKYLSDKILQEAMDLLEEKVTSLTQAQKIYEQVQADGEDWQDLKDELNHNGYVIMPKLTFTKFAEEVAQNQFRLENLESGFKALESTSPTFAGLFDDVDLHSTRLGNTPQKQNKTVSDLITIINKINLNDYNGDALGDAYEILIGQFASETGKKAGEFYTPQKVSELLTRLALMGQEDKQGLTVYDPTMGSGSLLLEAGKINTDPEHINYYGQEINTTTYNLARMNMFLHNINVDNQHLRNGDTLDADWPDEEPTNFDAVLMNPPYSAKWSANEGFLDDPRFVNYGVLPPKSKADYAFLLHGFYHLKNTGTMAIVLPHGVLFRGAKEGKIRQKLLEEGNIYAVIGLPSNLFYNTSIPTVILVLKKNRTSRDVLFIDASNDFEKDKKQNKLTEANITKILKAFKERQDVDKYAHLASYDEIKENDFNLNIPRYVDTFEEEEPIDIAQVVNDLAKVDQEIMRNKNELADLISQLHTDNDQDNRALQLLIKQLKDED